MDSRSPLSAGDYWYLGSPDPATDQLFRRACSIAWPYAVYCATRYHRDPQLAYELMDAAVENAARYLDRFNGRRSAIQLSYRIISVIKRLSKQRANNKEIALGMLSDLELLAQSFRAVSDLEQDAFVRQVFDRTTDRTRQILQWRLAGHTWRQIADELGASRITVWRDVQKEIRGLLQIKSGTSVFEERGERD